MTRFRLGFSINTAVLLILALMFVLSGYKTANNGGNVQTGNEEAAGSSPDDKTYEAAETPSDGDEDDEDYDPGAILPRGARFSPSTEHYEMKPLLKQLKEGEELPHSSAGNLILCRGDHYYYGDYVYTYETSGEKPGWIVGLSGDAVNKDSLGPIFDSICGKPVYKLGFSRAKLKKAPGLPKYLTIMHSAFLGCTCLEEMPAIPEGVTDLSSAFSGCTSLKTTTKIPDSVKRLTSTFENCLSLVTAPELPDGLEEMNRTFKGCASLINVPSIPDSVKGMFKTFEDCISLAVSPELPEQLRTMDSTFFNCTSLKTAPEIPANVESMTCVFENTALTEAPVLPAGLKDLSGTFSYTGIEFPPEIPQGVELIGGCFAFCRNLKKAPVLPDSIKQMEYAFYQCVLITEVPNLPEKVIIMDNAFSGCSSLETLPAIPESAESVRGFCQDCISLTGIIEFKRPYYLQNECIDAFKGTVKPIYLIGPYEWQLDTFLTPEQTNVQILWAD